MKNPKFSLGLVLVFLCLFFFISCVKKTAEVKQPNIVLIMADDLGYGDIACYGNTEYQTPNIDRLTAEGIKFTDYHSNGAVCTPTRAALLTGRYQQRSGLEGVIYVKGDTRSVGMSVDELTIADILKQSGYKTGMFGKWHLGYQKKYFPVNNGFERFYGYVSGNVDYISHYDNAGIYDWWSQTDSIYEEGYVTDLITDKALDFIDVNKDSPFFVYIAHEAPHWPYQGRNDKADRFPNVDFKGHGSRLDKKGAYKEMVEVMDENVGRVMDKISQLGLDENTLFIFCSDNGGVDSLGNNLPFAKHKATLWEGGHRVPASVMWKGKIESGQVKDQTVLSMDWFPTILSVAGIENCPVELDGVDLRGHLLNSEKLDDRIVFWRYRGQKAVRQGDWKYMETKEGEYLFNLKDDLGETNNLLSTQNKKGEELKKSLNKWELEMDQVPQITN